MTTGPDQAHLRRQGCRFVAMPNDNVKLNVEQNRVLKQLATLRAVAAASEARAKSLVGSTQHHAGLLQSSLKRLNTWQPDIVPQNDAAWLRDMAAELWLVASLAESAASTLVESAEADLAASRAGEGKALERVVEVCDERDTARARTIAFA